LYDQELKLYKDFARYNDGLLYFALKFVEQDRVAVILLTYIRNLLSSNVDRNTSYREVFPDLPPTLVKFPH
jgi:hypothetical protein